MEQKKMRLTEGEPPQTYVVEQVELPLQTERRLEALGLTRGTSVTMMNKKKKGAVIVKIRGTRFAVGKHIGDHIQVREGA